MHHLILVREADQQMSGSGCCGRVQGDLAGWDRSGAVFAERRATMGRMGEVYRAVREAFGDRVRITVVDPRNQLAFVPLVLRDALRYRVRPLAAARAVLGASVASGILDGRLLFRGAVPDPQAVVRQLAERLPAGRADR